MNKIYVLVDYKNNFGSKWKAKPYRSGFNKDLLSHFLKKHGWEPVFIQFKDVNFIDNWKGRIVIYTSSEEHGLYYKNFIEDIVLGLERAGAIVIPRFDFLRANNNKVYMEILREQLLGVELSGNTSKVYGTLEELYHDLKQERIKFPCVIKKAEGAMSRGVFLAKNNIELIKYAKNISRTQNYYKEIKELVRSYIHPGYEKESKYQLKFIVQNYIAGLQNDWKILIFGNHYYVLNRGIKETDFRASGSHYNYKAGSKAELPEMLLDKVKYIYQKIDTPHLSLDFAYNGEIAIMHEFQAIHFGTSTIDLSDDLFIFEDEKWQITKAKYGEEEEYVRGLVKFMEKHSELLEK